MESDKLKEYEAKVSRILNMLTKPVLSLEDEAQIMDFINDYWHKYEIFTNEEIVPDVWKSIEKGKKVITEAFNLTTPAAKIIIDEFTKRIESSTRDNKNKGAKLVRINPNGATLPSEDDQNLDVAGFTNVAIILIGTLILGLILAAIIVAK